MKAMILAAGRGERMRPLTDNCPKPLLEVQGMPLIEYHIIKLAAAGFTDIVINHSWIGQKIEEKLGSGKKWQVNLHYSDESQQALETAGGIIKALPLLGDEPFLVVNGDVFTDFTFKNLPTLTHENLAHLFLTENPEHNLLGDFSIDNGQLTLLTTTAEATHQSSYTYSGIAIFHPDFFNASHSNNGYKGESKKNQDNILPLAPMLRLAAADNKISASMLSNTWTDVGTPERLAQLNQVR
jgi:MurNAc alpha-1-phosphate uridylyltransferase